MKAPLRLPTPRRRSRSEWMSPSRGFGVTQADPHFYPGFSAFVQAARIPGSSATDSPLFRIAAGLQLKLGVKDPSGPGPGRGARGVLDATRP
jgi:hypothetical protein